MQTKPETPKQDEAKFPLSDRIAAQAGLEPGQMVTVDEFARILIETNLNKLKGKNDL